MKYIILKIKTPKGCHHSIATFQKYHIPLSCIIINAIKCLQVEYILLVYSCCTLFTQSRGDRKDNSVTSALINSYFDPDKKKSDVPHQFLYNIMDRSFFLLKQVFIINNLTLTLIYLILFFWAIFP